MEIQVVITSIITYLVLLNSSLTFRLKFLQNIIVTIILALNMVIVGNEIGSLFVIPMFVMISLYIVYIKREDWFWNVFLILFSYTLLVIIDNFIHFVWNILGLNMSIHWPLYMIIAYPIFWKVCSFISKNVVRIKNKEILNLSSKMIALIGSDLIVCMLIFVIQIMTTEQKGYLTQILMIDIVVYIAYFMLTAIMIYTIIKESEMNAKITLKQNSYDNLQEYMSQIEELYQNLRVFRHDFANIMVSMSAYIEENNISGLKDYYDKHILPISHLLNKEKDVLARLHNLDIIELKGLLSVKINYALALGIKIEVEIVEKVEKINMDSIDLVRIIGVLLDNAIEASQECKTPFINVSIIKMNQDVTFIVKNSYIKQNIDYSKLGSLGVTSKGERRGIGLYNIRSIINEYDNVIMDTEYTEDYFTQVLEVYGSN